MTYEVLWKGEGWRAALEGSKPDRARLVGAIAAMVMALVLQPFMWRRLQKTTRLGLSTVSAIAGPVHISPWRSRIRQDAQSSRAGVSSTRRGFYVFPWLIPAFAILHYLANNVLLLSMAEAIPITVAILAAATALYIGLRLIFKTAATAAVLTGLLGIAFFSYGHIYVALGERGDHILLFGLAVPTVLALGALMRLYPTLPRKIAPILNVASVVLVVAPVYQIASHFLAASPSPNGDSQVAVEAEERVGKKAESVSSDMLRDIYFIVLDEYSRSGSPEHFDNSAFVQELENRGFYVAPQARSNYISSFLSIPSSLNMEYVGEDNSADDVESRQLVEMADDHRLGRILKTLGYKYVHVSSGWLVTSTNSNADLVVDFTPSGRVISGTETQDPSLFATYARLSGRFTTTFLRTTAASPFLSHQFSAEDDVPYRWPHPFRTLAWLDFMKEVASINGPKFVFAHLVKPHGPASFDKYGNITFDLGGWSDDHDPTVSEAFYGTVLYLNARMLEVIDAILDDYEEPPIIVIAGDHGHEKRNPSISHDILAAFLLPDGGETALYPSITSVNHFRAILDYYFELNLGLLEDRVYHSAS